MFISSQSLIFSSRMYVVFYTKFGLHIHPHIIHGGAQTQTLQKTSEAWANSQTKGGPVQFHDLNPNQTSFTACVIWGPAETVPPHFCHGNLVLISEVSFHIIIWLPHIHSRQTTSLWTAVRNSQPSYNASSPPSLSLSLTPFLPPSLSEILTISLPAVPSRICLHAPSVSPQVPSQNWMCDIYLF